MIVSLNSLRTMFTFSLAWFSASGSKASTRQFPSNRFGFYDLGGNVWEWCEDRYRASMNDPELLEKYEFLKDEVHEDGSPFYVLRGISWYYVQEPSLLFSLRNRDRPTFRNVVRGFRVALDLGVEE